MIPQDVVAESKTVGHLERHELELDVLATVSALMAKQTVQQRMLSEVLEQLECRLGMLNSTVMLLSPDGNELIVEAARSIASAGSSDLALSEGRRRHRSSGSYRPAFPPSCLGSPRSRGFSNRVYQQQTGETREASFICVPIMWERGRGHVVGRRPRQDSGRGGAGPLVANRGQSDRVRREVAANGPIGAANLEAENLRLRSALQDSSGPKTSSATPTR